MSKKSYVVGVGMTKFMKPSDNNPDYPEMAKTAARRALFDCAINFKEVQAVAVGYVYGDSTCGQRYHRVNAERCTRWG
jgi:sterol carrier protein 2